MKNRDFPKNEFFPLWHPVLPPVRAASAAKQTSLVILGCPLSADQVLSKSELTQLTHVQGPYMKFGMFDTRALKLGISVANLDENSLNLASTLIALL